MVDFFIDPTATRPVRVVRALVMLALCAAMTAFAVYESFRQLSVERWPQAPCTITASRVTQHRDRAHDATPYVFEVTYDYDWAGRRLRGNQFRLDYTGSEAAAEAYALLRAHPPGQHTTCRVNPVNPAESALEPSSSTAALALLGLLGGLSILLTAFYVVPQLRGREFNPLATWRRHRPATMPFSPPAARLSSPKSRGPRTAAIKQFLNPDAIIASIFSLLLILAGYECGLRPIARASLAATTWQPTPCRILSSAVARSEEHGGEGTVILYRADVLYRYTVAGQEYSSNACTTWDVSSPFCDTGKRAITRKYPAGSAATCYVNPANTAESILDTHVPPAAIVGLTPIALGLLLAAWAVGEARGSPRVWRACVTATALLASALTGFLFAVVATDVTAAWRAGDADIWGSLVALLLLATTAWTGYAFTRSRRRHRTFFENAFAPRTQSTAS